MDCPEGLLFDDSIPNHEKCVLPHNVDCGSREFVQEPSEDRDPKCEKANGVFNHPDENVTNTFNAIMAELLNFPAPTPLYLMSRLAAVYERSKQVMLLDFVMEMSSMKWMDSPAPDLEMLLDPKTFSKPIPSTL